MGNCGVYLYTVCVVSDGFSGLLSRKNTGLVSSLAEGVFNCIVKFPLQVSVECTGTTLGSVKMKSNVTWLIFTADIGTLNLID